MEEVSNNDQIAGRTEAARAGDKAQQPESNEQGGVQRNSPVVLVIDDHLNRVEWLLNKVRASGFRTHTAQGQGELAAVIAEIDAQPGARGWIFVDAFLERFGNDFGLLKMPQVRLSDEYAAGFTLVERVLPKVFKRFSAFSVLVMSEQDKDYTDDIKRIEKFANCKFVTKEQLRAELDSYLMLTDRQSQRNKSIATPFSSEEVSAENYLRIAKGIAADLGFSPDQLATMLGSDTAKSESELQASIAEFRDLRVRIQVLFDIIELLSMIVDDSKIAQQVRRMSDPQLGPYAEILLRGNFSQLLYLKMSLQEMLGGAL